MLVSSSTSMQKDQAWLLSLQRKYENIKFSYCHNSFLAYCFFNSSSTQHVKTLMFATLFFQQLSSSHPAIHLLLCTLVFTVPLIFVFFLIVYHLLPQFLFLPCTILWSSGDSSFGSYSKHFFNTPGWGSSLLGLDMNIRLCENISKKRNTPEIIVKRFFKIYYRILYYS